MEKGYFALSLKKFINSRQSPLTPSNQRAISTTGNGKTTKDMVSVYTIFLIIVKQLQQLIKMVKNLHYIKHIK